ncbi:MAG: UDP-N-acetylmuramoyl-tripeptide--D-alanyl-D-alanine ligase [Actinomycetota bacterium]
MNVLGLPDPFYGYSFLLRMLIYVVLPAFGVWQFVRLRRALHVYQLEAYKPRQFLSWVRANPGRARFLRSVPAKKALVMTGRAWRILGVATALSVLGIFGAWAIGHLVIGGWPADFIAYFAAMGAAFLLAPQLLVLTDKLLSPVQRLVNARYERAARKKLEAIGPVVIGVTGSFGKTSIKFAIEKLVAPAGRALATPGSYNTPMGVVRSVNENLTDAHRFFVVEMGAKQRGDIAELVVIARPTIGVLTAIGPAHLETFGSLDGVRKAKYELIEGLPDDGVAVMNSDDPEVRALAEATDRLRVVRYGIDPEGKPDVTASEIEVTARGTRFKLTDLRSGDTLSTRTSLLGRHAIANLLGAVAVVVETGRPLDELGAPISSLSPVEHRLQLIEGAGGVTVIDDAFNSNPAGSAAALEVLEAMPARRRVVVTPGMIELGELQAPANESFGEQAGRIADVLVVVARVNRAALVAGAERSSHARIVTVDSLDQAQRELQDILGPGDVVLFENDLPDQYEG